MTTVTREAERLRSEIRHHDHLYYNLNTPSISDSQYDDLYRLLVALERENPGIVTPDSPTQRVAGNVSSTFEPVPHDPPMLSLDNAASEEDFLAWHSRMARAIGTDNFPMVVEYKFDGVAIRADYVNNLFHLAATRGNGSIGEDVTQNARAVKSLPLSIYAPDLFSAPRFQVRGEIYMPRAALQSLNAARDDAGEDPYSNTRNAAAGALRNHDPHEVQRRGLAVWFYDTDAPHIPTSSHYHRMEQLRDDGFPVNQHRYLAQTPQAAIHFYNELLLMRPNVDFDADGVVVRVDDSSLWPQIGYTGHSPRWAIAWKFPAQTAVTLLKDIVISVGRFGKLSPVAVLEPVQIDGVTVSSALLHNEQDVIRKDIRKGDRVVVERAGSVIPHVLGPENADPNRDTPVFAMPPTCPNCDAPVLHKPDDAAHWCVNEECGNRPFASLKHFVSKDAMDIDGFGENLCRQLVDRELVNLPTDIYNLTTDQIASLNRMGPKSAAKVVANIQASTQRPYKHALYSLGIYRLGRHVSEILAARYPSVEEISQLTMEELLELPDVSHVIADSIYRGLRSPRVIAIIDAMKSAGVPLKADTQPEPPPASTSVNPQPWRSMVFCVTGTLDGMTRTDAEGIIRALGGIAKDSVTRQTEIVVHGAKPGSKLAKAQQNGIQTWDQNRFFAEIDRYR